MKSSFGAAVMLIASAAAAQAQDVSGVFSLGYGENRLANPSIRVNENTIKGRVRAQMGNGLSFGVQAGGERTYSPATSSGALDRENFGIDAAFTAQNGGTVGAYLESNSFDLDSSNLISTNAVGLMGGYVANGLSLKGFLGSAVVKDEPLVDITAVGVNLSYDMAQNFTLGAAVSQHAINNSTTTNTVNTFGLAAAYNPTAALGLHGGLSSINFDATNARLTEMGFGASYNVNVNGTSPILATIELVNNDFSASTDGYSVDTIRLGVTLPLGRAASKVSVPINSAADKVFQPIRNVIGAAGQAAF